MPAKQLNPEDDGSLIDDVCSNAYILNHGLADFLPSLADHERDRDQSRKGFDRLAHMIPWNVFNYSPTAFFYPLTDLAINSQQLLRGLPPSTRQSSHVYAVTLPHRPFAVSLHHWSVYSQGYFYHLSTSQRRTPTVESGKFSLGNKTAGAKLTLKVEDFSTVESEEYLNITNTRSRKAFAAYEMGSTQYSPAQIQLLAQYIIDGLGAYDLTTANCQTFAILLIYRVVMTRRDCSVFAGTKRQLADWDLRTRNDAAVGKACSPYDWQHGYVIRKPQPGKISIFQKYISISESKLRAIRHLYEGGLAGKTPIMDPTGRRGILYISPHEKARLFDQDWLLFGRMAVRANRETIEDILAMRWGDALRGRKETVEFFDNFQPRVKSADHLMGLYGDNSEHIVNHTSAFARADSGQEPLLPDFIGFSIETR